MTSVKHINIIFAINSYTHLSHLKCPVLSFSSDNFSKGGWTWATDLESVAFSCSDSSVKTFKCPTGSLSLPIMSLFRCTVLYKQIPDLYADFNIYIYVNYLVGTFVQRVLQHRIQYKIICSRSAEIKMLTSGTNNGGNNYI